MTLEGFILFLLIISSQKEIYTPVSKDPSNFTISDSGCTSLNGYPVTGYLIIGTRLNPETDLLRLNNRTVQKSPEVLNIN